MYNPIENLGAYGSFPVAAKVAGGVDQYLNNIRNEALVTGHKLGWKAGSVFGYSVGFQDGFKKAAIIFGIVGGITTIGGVTATILYFKHKEKKNKQLQLRN